MENIWHFWFRTIINFLYCFFKSVLICLFKRTVCALNLAYCLFIWVWISIETWFFKGIMFPDIFNPNSKSRTLFVFLVNLILLCLGLWHVGKLQQNCPKSVLCTPGLLLRTKRIWFHKKVSVYLPPHTSMKYYRS